MEKRGGSFNLLTRSRPSLHTAKMNLLPSRKATLIFGNRSASVEVSFFQKLDRKSKSWEGVAWSVEDDEGLLFESIGKTIELQLEGGKVVKARATGFAGDGEERLAIEGQGDLP
jgi:hypothetical protein